ncbi:hypothetical protein C8A00DRAFT_30961 [Chaetomidium leptoderma]|uniref:Uncharacterized protein n=1 Tax=Chaetomidium leptoderma TaxID=669021 RepID=A0AAN6VRB7_9PEZI|nr:hypothetical protein C8A00DRAFT_30961 [Chaetomidium leptoderma]
MAKKRVEQAISSFDDATTLDLGGPIDLGLARTSHTLEPSKLALGIRNANLSPEDPIVACSLGNIALAGTETGSLDLARAAQQEAIALRLKASSDRIGNSYSSTFSLLLQPREILAWCSSLKDVADETVFGTPSPRFSGDTALLLRIQPRAQGRPVDTLRLASKARRFRESSGIIRSRPVIHCMTWRGFCMVGA